MLGYHDILKNLTFYVVLYCIINAARRDTARSKYCTDSPHSISTRYIRIIIIHSSTLALSLHQTMPISLSMLRRSSRLRALFREEEARKNKETINNNNLNGPALRNNKGGIYSSLHISSCYYDKI
jgi:hypothetical protein